MSGCQTVRVTPTDTCLLVLELPTWLCEQAKATIVTVVKLFAQSAVQLHARE
jgi:hypothetical protein